MSVAESALQEGPLRRFKPYPAYKDSEVEWLGEIPAHWEVKPLKAASVLQTGLTLGKDYQRNSLVTRPYLRVANVQDGYLSLDAIAEVELPENDATRYELCQGDVLMTEGGDFDKLGRGCVWENQVPQCLHQNHIFAVRPRLGQLSPEFLALTMGSSYGRAYFTATSKQSTNLASTNSTKLRNFPLPLPSESEQCAIAIFLDREAARIDAMVAKKQRLIGLLQEQRTSLITRAVTKGLDPTVAMKDSGVEWLGEIPAHWEIKKWRYCCHVTDGQIAPDDDHFRERILIAPNHIESGTSRILYTETADEQGAISGKYLVKPGDIIYSKIRPALNKVCIAEGDWLCSADMYPVAITDLRLQPRFLLYFMLSEPFVRLMVDESMRVAMPKVNREKLAACPLIIGDSKEQHAIVIFLDRETARIDALINMIRDAIERLNELRRVLISAAVTGIIDVREVAP